MAASVNRKQSQSNRKSLLSDSGPSLSGFLSGSRQSVPTVLSDDAVASCLSHRNTGPEEQRGRSAEGGVQGWEVKGGGGYRDGGQRVPAELRVRGREGWELYVQSRPSRGCRPLMDSTAQFGVRRAGPREGELKMFSPSGEFGEPVLRTMSDRDMQDTGSQESRLSSRVAPVHLSSTFHQQADQAEPTSGGCADEGAAV
ncbi:unnamed protein product [Menidia menidia]|uniref:(Atlantic silverside) hypothetical protein n=1 Tax=Menidia menidia TaxID=238744 RepID=A0A8S4AJH5_9TELE|nr:unnamed protein product [Menidia menidia]